MKVVFRMLEMATLANVEIDESMINRQVLAFAWARVHLKDPRNGPCADL